MSVQRPSVLTENTPNGRQVAVIRCSDLVQAARMATVRWNAAHPGVALPPPRTEHRREGLGATLTRWEQVDPGTDRAIPTVVFALPTPAGASS